MNQELKKAAEALAAWHSAKACDVLPGAAPWHRKQAATVRELAREIELKELLITGFKRDL